MAATRPAHSTSIIKVAASTNAVEGIDRMNNELRGTFLRLAGRLLRRGLSF